MTPPCKGAIHLQSSPVEVCVCIGWTLQLTSRRVVLGKLARSIDAQRVNSHPKLLARIINA